MVESHRRALTSIAVVSFAVFKEPAIVSGNRQVMNRENNRFKVVFYWPTYYFNAKIGKKHDRDGGFLYLFSLSEQYRT